MFFLLPLAGVIASAVATATTTTVVGGAVGTVAVGIGVAKAAKSLAAAKDVVVVTGKGIVEVSSTDILSTGAAVALNKNKKEE